MPRPPAQLWWEMFVVALEEQVNFTARENSIDSSEEDFFFFCFTTSKKRKKIFFFFSSRGHLTVIFLCCWDLRPDSSASKRLILRPLLQLLGSMATIRELAIGWIFQRFKIIKHFSIFS